MRNLLWQADAFGNSNRTCFGAQSLQFMGAMMNVMPAICVGFGGALLTAILIGFGIGMAFPLLGGPSGLYAAEFAGVVISLAVFYFLARLFSKRHKSKQSVYAERLA